MPMIQLQRNRNAQRWVNNVAIAVGAMSKTKITKMPPTGTDLTTTIPKVM